MTKLDPIQQPIEIDADTQGADEAKRALNDVRKETDESAESTRTHADATRRAGDAFDDTSGKAGFFTRTVGGLKEAFSGLALGILGGAGVLAAFSAWREEIELTNQRLIENEQLTMRNAEARLDLAALKGFEDPEQLKELDRMAIFSGRSVSEAARLATVTQSIMPDGTFTEDQRSEFMAEVASQAQTSSASLTGIAGAIFPLIVEGLNAQQAGNVLQAGIKQAGQPDPEQFAQSVARFVSLGKEVGGLDVGQAVGYAAASTGLGLDKATAETGLKNLVLGIRTPNNPESQALLERLGINDEVSLDDSLRIIAQAKAEGRVSRSDLVNLSGREGLEVALKLSRQERVDEFLNKVAIVDAAEDITTRTAAEQSANINKPDTIQGYRLLAKQAQTGEETIRASDKAAARRDTAKKILGELVAEKVKSGELSEADATVIQEEFEYQLAQGQSIQTAIDLAERQQAGTSIDIPVPVPTEDDFFNIRLDRVNTNPIKTATGLNRSQDDFLEEDLLQRLNAPPKTDPATLQQGTQGGTVIQNQTIVNEQGTRFIGAGDPLVDDQDGRDRE